MRCRRVTLASPRERKISDAGTGRTLGTPKRAPSSSSNAGKLSRGQYDKIVAKANRKLVEDNASTSAQQNKDLDDYLSRKYGPQ